MAGRTAGYRADQRKGERVGRAQKLLPVCRESVRTSMVVQVKGEGRGGGDGRRRKETGNPRSSTVKSKIIKGGSVSYKDAPPNLHFQAIPDAHVEWGDLSSARTPCRQSGAAIKSSAGSQLGRWHSGGRPVKVHCS